jgi:colanic acid biosynthesis glycosyl transferase WcaI
LFRFFGARYCYFFLLQVINFMRVLIFAQHFYPEEVSGAVLATELAESLLEKGHQVTFVTCVPNYPYGKAFQGYSNSFIHKENIRGVEVIRVWSYISPKISFWRRIINYGTFSLFSILGGLLAKKPDIIFSYSPPLPLGVAAWLIARLKRIPWILRVEDLYPDAAVSAGILKNKFAIRFFYWLEKFIYKRADKISVISEGFKEIIESKGISPSKIEITPVWANPETIIDKGSQTEFRKAQGFTDEYIILYAGNLGHTSDLEVVIDAAEKIQSNQDIQFVLVGEGVKKKSLEERTHQKRLKHVRFLPYQPREKFGDMMTSADLFIVTLNERSSNYSVPSKTFNCMASSRAILSISPKDSEISQLINRYQCGVVVEPGDPERIIETILSAYNDPERFLKMGKNGRAALEKHFSKTVCVDQIHSFLRETLAPNVKTETQADLVHRID